MTKPIYKALNINSSRQWTIATVLIVINHMGLYKAYKETKV